MLPEHTNYIEEWKCDHWLAVSALVFTDMISFQQPHVPEINGKDWIKEEEQLRKNLKKWHARVHGVPISNTGGL